MSFTRHHGQLSSCTIPEKNNYPILRKFSDGRTDRQKAYFKMAETDLVEEKYSFLTNTSLLNKGKVKFQQTKWPLSQPKKHTKTFEYYIH